MSEPAPTDYKIIDVIIDVLTFHMDLSEDQIWIYNQKRKIPDAPGLFIEVAFVGSRPFGSNIFCDDDEVGNFCEFQAVNVQEAYKIILYSRDESAFSRSHEVLFAMNSNAMQQACEKNHFHIGRIPPSFIDTSAVEASARLFRQDLDFQTLRHYTKKRVIDYFDQFNIPPDLHVNQ